MHHYFSHHHLLSNTSISPEWVTALTALMAGIVAIYEFYFRRRPYLKIEVEGAQQDSSVTFLAKIVNFGTVPVFFRLNRKEIVIKIGDEIYQASGDPEGYSFPNETQSPKIELGKINQSGLNKLLNREYNDNSAFLEVTLNYRSSRSWRDYKFYCKYKIEFSKNAHGEINYSVLVVKQEFH